MVSQIVGHVVVMPVHTLLEFGVKNFKIVVLRLHTEVGELEAAFDDPRKQSAHADFLGVLLLIGCYPVDVRAN